MTQSKDWKIAMVDKPPYGHWIDLLYPDGNFKTGRMRRKHNWKNIGYQFQDYFVDSEYQEIKAPLCWRYQPEN